MATYPPSRSPSPAPSMASDTPLAPQQLEWSSKTQVSATEGSIKEESVRRRSRPALSNLASAKLVARLSWLNYLLVCVPVAWILHFVLPTSERSVVQDAVIFLFAFTAIIPLANLLSFSTDQLAMRQGESLAALFNVTLGNFVELIVAFLALLKGDVEVVQASLVGSVLSNNLFVFGLALLCGGAKYKRQPLGNRSAVMQTTMAVAMASVPAIIVFFLHQCLLLRDNKEDALARGSAAELKISRGMAFLAILVYAGIVFFQNGTHKSLIAEEDEKPTESDLVHWERPVFWKTTSRAMDEEEEVKISNLMLSLTLGGAVGIVGYTAEVLVASIDGMTNTGNISKEFVSLILLPIPGNAAEHWTAVSAALNNRVTMSMGISLGSSVQVSMFLYPLMIELAWAMGKQLSYLTSDVSFLAFILSVGIVIIEVITMLCTQINWWMGVPPLTVFVMVAIVCLLF